MTVAERHRIDAFRHIGCIACRLRGIHSLYHVHHIVDKGYSKHSGGHMATIPLCPWHHVGECPAALSEAYMVEIYGSSMKLHKKAFIAEFGTERELLARVDLMIEARAA